MGRITAAGGSPAIWLSSSRIISLLIRCQGWRMVVSGASAGHELLSSTEVTGTLDLAPQGVAIVRRPRPTGEMG